MSDDLGTTPPEGEGDEGLLAGVVSLEDRRRVHRAKLARERANAAAGTRREADAEREAQRAELAALDLDAREAELRALVAKGVPADAALEVEVSLRTARGAQMFARGDHEGGIAVLRALVADHPEQVRPRTVLATLLAEQREDEAAMEVLDRAAEIAPTDAGVFVSRGNLYFRRWELGHARANFLRAIQLDPSVLQAHEGLALSLAGDGDHPGAVRAYGRAIRLAPNKPVLYAERAASFEEMGALEQAIRDWSRCVALDPSDGAAFLGRGVCHRSRQAVSPAIADFTRAIELLPDDPEPLQERGVTYLLSGQVAEAIADLDRAIAMDEGRAMAHAFRGVAHQVRDDMERALADFERAVQLAPTASRILELRSQAHRRVGDIAGLRADLHRMVALNPTDVEMLLADAKVRMDEGNMQGALADLDRALSLGCETAELYHQRALALGNLGEMEEAVEAGSRAIEMEPDVARYHGWRGVHRSRIEGEEAAAEADLARAFELAPDDPVVLFQRAMFFCEEERWAEALAPLERLVELAPKEWAPVWHRGSVRLKLATDEAGVREAIADLDRAMELGARGDDFDEVRAEAAARLSGS
jgi:tetratricopeptide (TPR) repeat protein